MTIMYAVYEVRNRSYYEGGSSSWDELLFTHHDIDEIRSTLNKMWENKDLWEIRGRFQMVFPVDGMRTNEWFNNGGGCAASGYYEIREHPSASLEGYTALLRQRIDKEEAGRIEQQRRREEVDREWEAAKEAKWKREAEIKKGQERNQRRRAHYAANKDEINAKRREKTAKRAVDRAAAKIRAEETYVELSQWLTLHPNHTDKQWERAYARILKKYEDKNK